MVPVPGALTLRLGPGNNEATDQNVITGGNNSPSREVERSRSHCRKLRAFQVHRNGVESSVTAEGWIPIIEKSFGRRNSDPVVETSFGQSTINERVIN